MIFLPVLENFEKVPQSVFSAIFFTGFLVYFGILLFIFFLSFPFVSCSTIALKRAATILLAVARSLEARCYYTKPGSNRSGRRSSSAFCGECATAIFMLAAHCPYTRYCYVAVAPHFNKRY